MTERRYKLLNGFTLVVSEECLGVQLDTGMTITTDGDEIIDDVLALLNQTKSERDKAIRDLSDYKSKRGENLGEMLDARAEADRLRLELEAAREAYRNLRTPRSIDEWDEDYGDVLWWDFPPFRASILWYTFRFRLAGLPHALDPNCGSYLESGSRAQPRCLNNPIRSN